MRIRERTVLQVVIVALVVVSAVMLGLLASRTGQDKPERPKGKSDYEIVEMAWEDTPLEDREEMCWALDFVGPEWVAEQFQKTQGSISTDTIIQLMEDKCR